MIIVCMKTLFMLERGSSGRFMCISDFILSSSSQHGSWYFCRVVYLHDWTHAVCRNNATSCDRLVIPMFVIQSRFLKSFCESFMLMFTRPGQQGRNKQRGLGSREFGDNQTAPIPNGPNPRSKPPDCHNPMNGKRKSVAIPVPVNYT